MENLLTLTSHEINSFCEWLIVRKSIIAHYQKEYSDSHAVWSICLFSQIELEWYSREHFSAIDLAFLSTFRSTIPICSPKYFVL